jgi:serine/threonine-protein kinase
MPLLSSPEIGQYEVLYPLAAGGMASIHVARRLGLSGFERLVALKVVHPHLIQDDEEFVHMFLDEARLAASIHHPNVGEVLEVGEEQGLYYMVSELVLGHDLRGLVRRLAESGQRLSADLVAHLVSEVGRGLHAAHEVKGADGAVLNLVHRDVTPRNILLSYDGAVKLIDFGVAQARGRHTQSTVSTIKGKAGFVSPEAIRGEVLDRRSDIFSLGVVLYWLLTQTYPFLGRGQVDWIPKVLSGSFRRPREINPGIPPELEAVVLRAMALRADDRYATAAQMSDDLDAFIGARRCRDLGKQLSVLVQERFALELLEHEERLRIARGLPSTAAPPQKIVVRDRLQRTPMGVEVVAVGPDERRRVRWHGLIGVAAGVAATMLLTFFVLPLRENHLLPRSFGSPPVANIEVEVIGVPADALLLLDGRPVKSGTMMLPGDGAKHTFELQLDSIRVTRELLATSNTTVDFSNAF